MNQNVYLLRFWIRVAIVSEERDCDEAGRSAAVKEIDFVGPGFGGVGIESKYTDGNWRRDALTLKASPWRGIIATRSELDVADPRVAAVPAALLAWLIDA